MSPRHWWVANFGSGECQGSCRVAWAAALIKARLAFRTTRPTVAQLRSLRGPPFRVCVASPLIELVAAIEDIVLPTAMALVRREVADGTMPML
jgi:hypothetical protein